MDLPVAVDVVAGPAVSEAEEFRGDSSHQVQTVHVALVPRLVDGLAESFVAHEWRSEREQFGEAVPQTAGREGSERGTQAVAGYVKGALIGWEMSFELGPGLVERIGEPRMDRASLWPADAGQVQVRKNVPPIIGLGAAKSDDHDIALMRDEPLRAIVGRHEIKELEVELREEFAAGRFLLYVGQARHLCAQRSRLRVGTVVEEIGGVAGVEYRVAGGVVGDLAPHLPSLQL